MKMYVIVREDLDSTYRMVQGAHALAQYMIDFPGAWKNGTLVFAKVKNIYALLKLREELSLSKKKYSEFYEPDIGNELTAIACYDGEATFHNCQLV